MRWKAILTAIENDEATHNKKDIWYRKQASGKQRHCKQNFRRERRRRPTTVFLWRIKRKAQRLRGLFFWKRIMYFDVSRCIYCHMCCDPCFKVMYTLELDACFIDDDFTVFKFQCLVLAENIKNCASYKYVACLISPINFQHCNSPKILFKIKELTPIFPTLLVLCCTILKFCASKNLPNLLSNPQMRLFKFRKTQSSTELIVKCV